MRTVFQTLLVMSMLLLAGCTEKVEPGQKGRITTPSGWNKEILKPGNHSCYGRDCMYVVDTTSSSFQEEMNILVGGKVNLKVNVTIRVKLTEDDDKIKKVFETVAAEAYGISAEKMYKTFLQMKVLSIPRSLYQIQPDVQAAVVNASKLEEEFRKRLMSEAEETPLIVEDCQVTNYDWPTSITNAQEELVKVQLREASAEAQVRADLKKAEGDLKVAEATKLVELKKAEAIGEAIEIISGRLAGCPEYLMWHQIKVMGEAANGPNNCFLLYPYNTDSKQVNEMITNTNLTQQLREGVQKTPTTKATLVTVKNPAPKQPVEKQ